MTDPALPPPTANQDELRRLIVASLAAAEHRAAQIAGRLQQTRADQQRLQAEQDTARETYRRIHNQAWWDHATPHELANVIEIAATWAQTDLAALYAVATITDQLQDRTGLDLDTLYHQPSQLPDNRTTAPTTDRPANGSHP